MWWERLMAAAVPVLILSPLAAAVLASGCALRNTRAAARIEFSGATIALLAAAFLAARYVTADQSAGTLVGPLEFRWTPPIETGETVPDGHDGPVTGRATAQVLWRVDGLSLWPSAAAALIVWSLLLAERRGARKGELPWVLTAESAALSAFSASGVVLLCVSLAAAAVAAPFVVAGAGGNAARPAARRLMLQQMTAVLMLSAGLSALVALHGLLHAVPHAPPFETAGTIEGLAGDLAKLTRNNPFASVIWQQVAPWAFLGVLAGCLLWLGVFPAHGAITAAQRTGSTASRVVSGCLLPLIGCSLLLRVVLMVFPELAAQFGIVVLVVAGTGILFLPVSLWAHDRPRGAVALAPAFAACLCAAAFLSASGPAVRGGFLLAIGQALSLALWLIVSGHRHDSADAPTGPSQATRQITVLPRGLQALASLSLAGMPGLAVFPGIFLILMSAAELERWFTGAWLLAVLGLGAGWLMFAASLMQELGAASGAATDASLVRTRSASGILAGALLIAAVLALGLRPQHVLDAANPALPEFARSLVLSDQRE